MYLNIDLQRMDKFYVQNLILPTGILLALSSLIFFLPSELSDRIGYGITVTLALCVNLVIVIDFIPETSRTIPSLCTYFLVCICLSGFSILLSTVSLNIASSHSQNETTVSKLTTDVPESEINSDTCTFPQLINNGRMRPSKNGENFENCLAVKVQDPMKVLDRTAGLVYFLATTVYTIYFLWN